MRKGRVVERIKVVAAVFVVVKVHNSSVRLPVTLAVRLLRGTELSVAASPSTCPASAKASLPLLRLSDSPIEEACNPAGWTDCLLNAVL